MKIKKLFVDDKGVRAWVVVAVILAFLAVLGWVVSQAPAERGGGW